MVYLMVLSRCSPASSNCEHRGVCCQANNLYRHSSPAGPIDGLGNSTSVGRLATFHGAALMICISSEGVIGQIPCQHANANFYEWIAGLASLKARGAGGHAEFLSSAADVIVVQRS